MIFQVLGVAAAVWLILATWQIWLLVFTALIVAAAILPAARLAARYHVPRAVTVLAVYLLAAGVVALMGRLLWPALSEQWTQFMEQLPRLVDRVMGWFGDLQRILGSWGAPLSAPKGESVQSVAGAVLANTLRITTGVFGVVIEVLAILVLAAYFVIDEREIGRLLLSFVPAAHRPTAQRLAPRVLDRVGGYVRGQLVSSVCVGILIAVMLSLMGVRYALLIGTLAAVFNVVPFVGATLAAGLAVLAALNESLGLAAATGGGMVAVQALEGKLLAPYFVGRATGLHALAVLLALLAGLHLAGLVGGLVAVPLVAGTWEVVRTLWVEPRRSA